MMEPYGIVLADDHVLFRRGMKKIIENMPGMEVVGEANDGIELIKMINNLAPDLALLDISMPNLSGIEALRDIRRISPKTKILILTMHKSREYLYHSISAGANGYLLKEDSDEELFAAIETIRNGAIYITRALAGSLSKDISSFILGEDRASQGTLTAREREVLKLITEGKTNGEIAAELGVSIRTVETHRANIMSKLGLKNTAELVKYAIQNGLC
jgi:DNA-binding NarL/FixJ family response regulator